MKLNIIEDGFRIEPDFHDYYFNYILRNNKWFMLISDSDNNPVSSEIPLKSEPCVVTDTFVKKVKSKFSEYPNDINKLDDILEEISVMLNANELKRINNIKKLDIPNSQFIGEKGEFKDYDFAQWLYKESKHYFVRIRQTDELYYYMGGIYIPHGETYIEEIIQREMADSVIVSSFHVNEIIKYIKRSVLNEIDITQIRTERLACKNGVIDLRTKKLSLHSPDNYMFKMIPWNYIDNAVCPKFDALINKFLPNDLERYKMNIMIGYPLINSYIYNKIFFLEGKSGAAKTTFTNILQPMYGINNVSNIRLHDLIEHKFMRVGLMDSYANFSGDASDTAINDASILKTLSGESRLSIDVKNVKHPIKLMNCSKLIIDTNNMPEFNLSDDAIFRRIIKITFNIIVEESEKTSNFMDEYLTESEMEGLLYKAVESAHLILTTENPFKSTSIAETKEEYENTRRNVVDKFITKHIQIYPKNIGDEKYELQTDVWVAFKTYCEIKGIEPEQIPDPGAFYKSFIIKCDIENTVNKWMPELKTTKKVYYGVKLKNLLF